MLLLADARGAITDPADLAAAFAKALAVVKLLMENGDYEKGYKWPDDRAYQMRDRFNTSGRQHVGLLLEVLGVCPASDRATLARKKLREKADATSFPLTAQHQVRVGVENRTETVFAESSRMKTRSYVRASNKAAARTLIEPP